jgi:hypothetical protein
MINKILSFIILSFLFFNTAYAAKKTTYLRCPLMMVENKGTSFASFWKVGDNLNELYAKVVEAKKTKISLHFYMTSQDYWKDQKPSDEDGLFKNLVFKKDNDELKWSDSFSDKFKDKTKKEMVETKFSTSFKFKDTDNQWSLIWLEYNEYIYEKNSSDNIHIKHKLGGDCIVIDKKLYKDFIKNGKV